MEILIKARYATGFWDEERDMWITEKDTYDVLVGNSPSTPLKASFEVEDATWWSGL